MSTHDDELDISALDAFCQVVKSAPELSSGAARLLAFKAQNENIKESLLALDAFEGELLLISVTNTYVMMMIID